MLTRCVVVVDADYLREAAALQLTGKSSGKVVLRDVGALLAQLQALAEDATGEDLLRVYWYDSPDGLLADAELLVAQPYLTVRPRGHNTSLAAADSTLAEDLSALQAQIGCGDLLVCTADSLLAPILAQVQLRCRHVHWLRVGDTTNLATSPLWTTSDTRQSLLSEAVAEAFQVMTTAAERNAPHAALKGTGGAPLSAWTSRIGASANREARMTPAATSSPTLLPVTDDAWDIDPFARPLAARKAPDRARVVDHSSVATPNPMRADEQKSVAAVADRSLSPHSIPFDQVIALTAIAVHIAEAMGPHDHHEVRRWQRGVPADVDRQLLAASYARLGRRLEQFEKVLLRRVFVEECERQAANG